MSVPVEDLSFEQAFAELEHIVRILEEGSQPLADTLALYERGIRLARHCHKLLDEADLRIKQLVPNGLGGYDEEEFTGPLDSR